MNVPINFSNIPQIIIHSRKPDVIKDSSLKCKRIIVQIHILKLNSKPTFIKCTHADYIITVNGFRQPKYG